MIKSLSLLPSCESATQIAVKLKLDSLPAVPELVAAVVVLLLFAVSWIYCFLVSLLVIIF